MRTLERCHKEGWRLDNKKFNTKGVAKPQNSFLKGRGGQTILPILTLDPGGQELSQLHGEAVAVQVVELLQIPGLQLLQLVPLSHPDKRSPQTCKGHKWGRDLGFGERRGDSARFHILSFPGLQGFRSGMVDPLLWNSPEKKTKNIQPSIYSFLQKQLVINSCCFAVHFTVFQEERTLGQWRFPSHARGNLALCDIKICCTS